MFSDNGSETYWTFTWTNLFGRATDTVRVEKDTLVNGLSYKKLTISPTGHLYEGGLMRENTVTGEVWFRDIKSKQGSATDTLERLAFRFDLHAGDTFDISCMVLYPGTYPDSFNIVDSVRTINGLKHIYFKGIYNNEPYTIIEGVGSNVNVIWKSLQPGALMGSYLLCSYKNGVKTTYENRQFNGACYVGGGMSITDNLLLPQDIIIYPQPAVNILNVNVLTPDKPISYCAVYDLYGRKIIEVQKADITIIEVNNLAKGVYVLYIKTDDGLSARKTFTKG